MRGVALVLSGWSVNTNDGQHVLPVQERACTTPGRSSILGGAFSTPGRTGTAGLQDGVDLLERPRPAPGDGPPPRLQALPPVRGRHAAARPGRQRRARSTLNNDTAIAPVLRHIFHSAQFAAAAAQQGATGLRGPHRPTPGRWAAQSTPIRSATWPTSSTARAGGSSTGSGQRLWGHQTPDGYPDTAAGLDLRRRPPAPLGDRGRGHGHLARRLDARRRRHPAADRPHASAPGSRAWPAACSASVTGLSAATASPTCPSGSRTPCAGSPPSGLRRAASRTGPSGPTPTSTGARSPTCSGRSRAARPATRRTGSSDVPAWLTSAVQAGPRRPVWSRPTRTGRSDPTWPCPAARWWPRPGVMDGSRTGFPRPRAQRRARRRLDAAVRWAVGHDYMAGFPDGTLQAQRPDHPGPGHPDAVPHPRRDAARC